MVFAMVSTVSAEKEGLSAMSMGSEKLYCTEEQGEFQYIQVYLPEGEAPEGGWPVAPCAGWAPANHDVWSDQDWSRTAACADANDAPYYLLTGTYNKVCVADTRAVGFVNLMLEKGVNVNFTIVPDAIHMDDTTGDPFMFFARCINLGIEDQLWDWFHSVLDGTLEAVPEFYELTYDAVELGAGSLWSRIYEANKGIIKDPNLIYAGQVLLMP